MSAGRVIITEGDGINLCPSVKTADDDTLVILLTARDEAEEWGWH